MERQASFVNKLADGFEIVSVFCDRLHIVPAPNDYKIAVGNTKLVIRDIGEGHPKRSGELTRTADVFSFLIKEGEPLSGDLAAIGISRKAGARRQTAKTETMTARMTA
jgi:hypothetical protein